MFPLCPKCRQPIDAAVAPSVCPACGLVFAKFLAAQRGESLRAGSDTAAPADADGWRDRLLAVPARVPRWQVYGRALLYAVFFVWGLHLAAMDVRIGEICTSFTHAINLVFHEAGHVIFMPFGAFLHTAGGTLGQWLMPIIVGVALHRKNHDNFGASLALWWLAVSFMDAAPYAWDAADPVLPLLGGGTGADSDHDWIIMLSDLGWLPRAHRVGHLLHAIGVGLLVTSYVWGGLVLLRQYRNRSDDLMPEAGD